MLSLSRTNNVTSITPRDVKKSKEISEAELIQKVEKFQQSQIKIKKLMEEANEIEKQLESEKNEESALLKNKSRLEKVIVDCDEDLAKLAVKKLNLIHEKTQLEANNQQLIAEKKQLKAKNDELIAEKNQKEASNKRLIEQSQQTAAKITKAQAEKVKLEAEKEAIRAKRLLLEEQLKNQTSNEQKVKARAPISFALPQVLGITPEVFNSSFTADKIDLFVFDGANNLIKINEAAMNTIIDFLKSHKTVTKVNLLVFKDQFQDKALVNFFNALPETGVKSIGINRKLNQDEVLAQANAQKNVPGLKIVNKAQ